MSSLFQMRKKRKIKKQFKIILVILLLFIVGFVIYKIGTGRVSKDDTIISFEVTEGSSYSSLASSLKEQHLIKSKVFYRLYIKLHHPDSLRAGKHNLSKNMNLKELIDELENHTRQDYVTITFKEGINFRNVISLITNNFNITEEEILTQISDSSYLDELISQYWFLTDDIKNKEIYYSLEGYLFPDTYQFDENSNIKNILKIMLDNMSKKLEPYKDKIKDSSYSIHEIMTMASIVELEASNSDDRAGVAGVFYNRLKSGWSLGSDVTTYYGLKLDLSERDLYQSEINAYSSYNTRSSKMAGKLPVGPICMPGLESLVAAIEPENHQYYYFVADKNKKTYFNETSSQHVKTVSRLKSEGLWYEY